jgi:hypothetical protein
MGTAFTYQGWLTDSNDPADGLYDLQFKLYDAPTGGTQQGITIDISDDDVIDGYFRVALDFGNDPNIFNGQARWLEIAVRPGNRNDDFSILSPRQNVMPTPYALHTCGIFLGTNNTHVGLDAGANRTAHDNTFLGAAAGNSNTTGWSNTFSGGRAGYSNTTDYENTFLGYSSGHFNTTGNDNTFLGREAGLHNTKGSRNTFSGNHAGACNSEGSENTFLGSDAGFFNTTGHNNTFLGYEAGCHSWKGYGNTFLGVMAGYNNQTGFYNVFIGNNAGFDETGSNKLYITNTSATPLIYGEFDNKSVGINTKTPGGYTLAVNGSAAKVGGGSWSDFSDVRLKDIHGSYEHGLAEIDRLNPILYSYRGDNDLDLPTDKEYVGVSAQEVQTVIPEAVERNNKGYLMVNNDPIIWAMVNAIKELKTEIDQLKQRLEICEKAIQQQAAGTKEVQE